MQVQALQGIERNDVWYSALTTVYTAVGAHLLLEQPLLDYRHLAVFPFALMSGELGATVFGVTGYQLGARTNAVMTGALGALSGRFLFNFSWTNTALYAALGTLAYAVAEQTAKKLLGADNYVLKQVG